MPQPRYSSPLPASEIRCKRCGEFSRALQMLFKPVPFINRPSVNAVGVKFHTLSVILCCNRCVLLVYLELIVVSSVPLSSLWKVGLLQKQALNINTGVCPSNILSLNKTKIYNRMKTYRTYEQDQLLLMPPSLS